MYQSAQAFEENSFLNDVPGLARGKNLGRKLSLLGHTLTLCVSQQVSDVCREVSKNVHFSQTKRQSHNLKQFFFFSRFVGLDVVVAARKKVLLFEWATF